MIYTNCCSCYNRLIPCQSKGCNLNSWIQNKSPLFRASEESSKLIVTILSYVGYVVYGVRVASTLTQTGAQDFSPSIYIMLVPRVTYSKSSHSAHWTLIHKLKLISSHFTMLFIKDIYFKVTYIFFGILFSKPHLNSIKYA